MSIDKRQVLEQAQKLLDKGLIDRAIKLYLRVIESEPDDVFVLQKIAGLHVKNGAFASAVEYYEKAFRVFKIRGFHEKCIGTLKRLLEIESTRLDFHHELAKSQIALGRIDEAIATLSGLIGIYEKRGDRDNSLSLLRELVKIKPTDWMNRVRLAEGYAARGKNVLALSAFEEALSTLLDSGDLVEHARISERVLFLFPNEKSVAIALARNYVDRARVAQGLAWLHRLFKEEPNNEQVLELLGDVFEMQSRPEKALAVFKEARRIYASKGQSSKEAEVVAKIRRLDPEAPIAANEAPQHIALTSLQPRAIEPECSAVSTLKDAAVLIEFGLESHALMRLERLGVDHVADESQFDALNEIAALSSGITSPELSRCVSALISQLPSGQEAVGSVEEPPKMESATIIPAVTIPEADLSEPPTSSSYRLESDFELDDIGDLNDISFGDFEQSLSLAGTDLDDDEEFEFSIDEIEEFGPEQTDTDNVDPFSDLLNQDAGQGSTINDTSNFSAILETRERFPAIRPTQDDKDTEATSDASTRQQDGGDPETSSGEFGGLLEPEDD